MYWISIWKESRVGTSLGLFICVIAFYDEWRGVSYCEIIMDNAEKKVKKLFDKRQWKFVMKVLQDNREQLINSYYKMLKGAMTESILLNLDEETSQIIPNRFQL